MTSAVPEPGCALCEKPATVVVEPPRRTFARGADPADVSCSITAILPDVLLCDEHGFQVRAGDRLIGWCDDLDCRCYGEVGEVSACGKPYETLVAAKRSRSAHPSK